MSSARANHQSRFLPVRFPAGRIPMRHLALRAWYVDQVLHLRTTRLHFFTRQLHGLSPQLRGENKHKTAAWLIPPAPWRKQTQNSCMAYPPSSVEKNKEGEKKRERSNKNKAWGAIGDNTHLGAHGLEGRRDWEPCFEGRRTRHVSLGHQTARANEKKARRVCK